MSVERIPILTYDNFIQTVLQGKEWHLTPEARERAKRSFAFLASFNKGKVIYGINTGFGPMAPYRINRRHQKELQYNLIRSHAAGGGAALSPKECRATLMVRLSTLAQGMSGIHPDVLELMTALLNQDAAPIIYETGGVGASGDLVQLAHLALGLIGEGEMYLKDIRMPSAEVLRILGLKPMDVHIREGLALMNGTACMTGLGLLNVMHAFNQIRLAAIASAMLNEAVRCYTDHFSEPLMEARPHTGQKFVAAFMRSFLENSHLTRLRSLYLYEKETYGAILKDKVQEYYSVRCVPQILGPILEAVAHARHVLVAEANSVNDNPVVDAEGQNVYHGGNFHGDYVAYEMDKVRIGLAKLGLLAERQLNFIMNPKLNGLFPPFANLGRLGLNFGLQGIQFTAVSAAAENQTLANPMSVHTIPNNNDNQDIVSMGTNAALLTRRAIQNNYRVLAVLHMALVQIFSLEELQSSAASASLSWLRTLHQVGIEPFREDKVRFDQVQKLEAWFASQAAEENTFSAIKA
jgi:histidine ammonia-lyase